MFIFDEAFKNIRAENDSHLVLNLNHESYFVILAIIIHTFHRVFFVKL